jgi:SAM-dependent methyltransferase
MYWDSQYKRNGLIWGEGPSELAVAAVKYLQRRKLNRELLNVLDIGCGYGRDAFHFLKSLRCRVLGIDASKEAITMASNAALKLQNEDVKFQCRSFAEMKESKYEIVHTSNVYQLLTKNEREELRRTITRTLKPNGLLFLSTHSVSDRELYGKGTPIPKEPNSFLTAHSAKDHKQSSDRLYLHLCTREELTKDFAFLEIRELYEHEYYEPRVTGETHHHVSWILRGENADTRHNTRGL